MKLQAHYKYVFLFLVPLYLYSCQKVMSSVDSSPLVDVYVAGYESRDSRIAGISNGIAKLWKNGEAITLSDGTDDCEASSIFVSASNIYVAGYRFDDHFLREISIAKYWTNGTPTKLSDGSLSNYTTSVAVSGNDVFITGFEMGTNGVIPKYWKNNSPVNLPLPAGAINGYAFSISVSRNDVFIAGSVDNKAVYWKNGTMIVLDDNLAIAYSITVADNSVFVCGIEYDKHYDFDGTLYLSPVAVIWKNGQTQRLTDQQYQTWASSIAVSGNDIYVAGYENKGMGYEAVYWENGELIHLRSHAYNAKANGIAVSGNDVYIAGNDIHYKSSRNSTWTESNALYWKNGNPVYLTDSTKESSANSIFISTR